VKRGVVVLSAVVLSAAGCLPAAGSTKPNVILIFADDISARELPVYGSSVWTDPLRKDTSDPIYLAKTPVLDRIAGEGVWIRTAWAATVCSPSRAMMMTGRYANLHKWWHNGDYGKAPNGNWIWPLYESSPLQIGHLARNAGYATQWAGKTQMKQCDHQRFGFDEGVFTPGSYLFPKNPYTDFVLTDVKGKKKVQVNEDTGEEVSYYAQTAWYWQPSVALMNHPDCPEPTAEMPITYWPFSEEDQKAYGAHTYGPDVELDFIFDFMERRHAEGKPFFIYHTTHLGHDAFNWFEPDSKSRWPGTPVIKWDGKKYTRTEPRVTGDKGVYDTHGTVTEPGMHSHVEYLDYQLWQYLGKLDELKIADNTVLIFCADNGTSGYGKASHDRQKGTHVPFMVYAPGLGFTKRGEQDILLNLSDVLPTLADIMNVEVPVDYEIHGKSLWPYLTTGRREHREWIYAYKQEKQLIRSHRVMRDGYGKWWDVSARPDDLISFPPITDWERVSAAHREERNRLEAILPRFAKKPEEITH
jgi:arylsulfatase A-like enzyme